MARRLPATLPKLGVLLAIMLGGLDCAILPKTEIGVAELGAGQEVDQAPVPVTMAEPVYSEFAREGNITGTVLLRARIGEDGRPHEVVVIRGVAGLDPAAVDAVKHCVFRPALRNGQPVSAWLNIPVTFRM